MPEGASPHSRPLSFDRVAARYDATRYMPAGVADSLAAFVTQGLTAEDWVLDAGIGTGRVGLPLAARHPRVVGVDISSKMMARMCRPEIARPSLVLADVRALPFPDATFARILAVHLLHLVPEWEKVVHEFWRVLRPNGAFIFVVEDRSPTTVREFYLNRAHERGLLTPHTGARSRQVITFLEERGVSVSSYRPPKMEWEQEVSVAETIASLRERTYSLLWEVPEEAHRALIAETEQYAAVGFPEPEATETVTTQLQIYVASR